MVHIWLKHAASDYDSNDLDLQPLRARMAVGTRRETVALRTVQITVLE